MKQKSIATLIATLAVIILTGAPVKADFLGLAPGDYTITLLSSTALCTTNCTGTVHIGNPGATGFDWSFIIQGNNFFFDTPNVGDTSISPNGLNSCAVESLVDSDSCSAADDSISVSRSAPALDLINGFTGPRWRFLDTGGLVQGAFTATPRQVPEPASVALLGFGALGLYLRRRRQR